MAGPLFYDRVQESTTTTGTGSYALGGATTGFQAWSAVGNGNTAYYMVTDGTNWETGLGTYSSTGPTLARTAILESSNANAAVSWGAGTKTVSLVGPAAFLSATAALAGTAVQPGDLAAVATSGSAADLSGTLPTSALPTPAATTLGGVKSLAATSHEFLTSIGTDGLPVAAQPAVADVTGAAPLASPTFTGTVSGVTAAMVGLGNVDNTSDATKNAATATLTNKRITPRIASAASSSSPTPAGDSEDQYELTALAVAATFAAPSGTPTDGQKLIIRIKDNGTARALSWNAIYRALGVTLPTTTVVSKTLYLGCIYNSADTKWDVVAVAQQA